MPSFSMSGPQNVSRAAVELHLHQVASQMDHIDLQSEILKAASRFQPEQSAADHSRALLAFRVFRDLAAVIQSAEHEDAGLEAAVGHGGPFHVRDERTASGGDDQLIVGLGLAIFAEHYFGSPEKPRGALARVQEDLVLHVPGKRVQKNLFFLIRTVQHIGKQNAIVVSGRLVAEHGDVELVRAAAGQNLFHGSGARHPVSDHHQVLFLHYAISKNPMSSKTDDLSPAGAAIRISTGLPGGMSSSTASGTWIASLCSDGESSAWAYLAASASDRSFPARRCPPENKSSARVCRTGT